MKISVAIMAHPKRSLGAGRLMNKLGSMPFHGVSLIYDRNNNEWATGVDALRSHVDSDWHIVLQDDAIIGDNFYVNALKAIENIPNASLLSFYTGTVRPYKGAVQTAIDKARATDASYLSFGTLNWGVGIAMPTKDIETVLLSVSNNALPYDSRLGYHYLTRNIEVYYTFPSIVDHDFNMGSLIGNDKSREPRRAHVFSDDQHAFSGGIVAI